MKRKKYLNLTRHAVVLIVTVLLHVVFYFSRPELAPIHRFWRATGDTGFILLFLALIIGPSYRIWPKTVKLVPWRRVLGVWFAIVAIVHSFSILDKWIFWNWQKFLGYEFVPQLNRVVRLEPGFGLANLLGLVAVIFAILLLSTSFDKAIKYLGTSTWKWIHNSAYVIFYLISLHAIYFLFIHFTQSFHKNPLPLNWFRWYAVVLMITLLVTQVIAALKSVVDHRRKAKQ